MALPVENRGVEVQSGPEPMPAKPAVSALTAPAPAPAPEEVNVRSGRVGGALAHPRVGLERGGAPFVECPFCDRRFELAHDAGEGPENERLAPGVYEGPHGH
ncbi:MAG TPA: zinc-finger domain-containing protein [Phenylobacterium sp.]|nr:zinc-finger domain-containing protein [Phenylobacterium sp.]